MILNYRIRKLRARASSILLEQHLISQNAGEDSYHPLTLVDLALKNI